MKKIFTIVVCLFALLAASLSAKAQEITITLEPGWNWISYPNAEEMDVASALGDFVPMNGDIVRSRFSSSSYLNGRWRGGVTHFMPGWGYMYYSSRTEEVQFVFAQPSSNVVATATPTDITAMSAVVGGMVMLPESSHVFQHGVCWGTEPNLGIDGNHTAEGEGAIVGSFSSTLEGLTPSTTYYVRAYVVSDYGLAYGSQLSFTTLDGSGGDHAYVDLGLPSGLLWATCNVGADNSEDYGDYFAWGETQPKDYFDWSTYQYCNGSENTLTKYCCYSSHGYDGFTDNLTILLPEDDAATANWGTDWRMATYEEWQELYNYTISTWTIQNGVKGQLFTASNGNSLFLPAAGYRNESNLYEADDEGEYWSSSAALSQNWPDPIEPFKNRFLGLDSSEMDPDAMIYHFWNFGGSAPCIDDCDLSRRCNGLPVRPVRSSGQNNVPIGAINGQFTINADGDQVYFSQGNLQYQASTNTWRFADNQYDYVGSDNSNISSSYSGWIDLFGWGTSGWNSGNTYYHPWNSNNSSGSMYGPPGTYSLTESYANADWGVYNPISNGGNIANQWRTLTQPEWDYVFNTRATTSGIRYSKANVNNVNGVILLPDDWSSSTYSLSNTNNSSASFISNTLTASQWSTLEQAGAVFLPAAGDRLGTSVYFVGSDGYYWSASYLNSSGAYHVYFGGSDLFGGDWHDRYFGRSVRLVRVAEN